MHFFKHPHKWFAAFLISPIHVAELHYKKKYHLNFVHARKLFVFDMTLLFSAIALIAGIIFWATYDPTVTDLVYVSIHPGHERLLSGQQAIYVASFKNESEVKLTSPKLIFELPQGFVFESQEHTWQKDLNFDSTTLTYALSAPIEPGEEASFTVSGIYYGTPHIETNLKATLVYIQQGRVKSETKSGPHLSILRGSVLKSSVLLPTKILSHTTVPFSLTLRNEGDNSIYTIVVPLTLPNGAHVQNLEPNKGIIKDTIWMIDQLDAQESIELKGNITINIPKKLDTFSIDLTPEITLLETEIPQETVKHTFEIVHPHVKITSNWENGVTNASPNETKKLHISVTNDSNVTLQNAQIVIPTPSTIIAVNKLAQVNNASVQNNTLILDKRHDSSLGTLAPGDSVDVTLNIPIIYSPQGTTDIQLLLEPQVNANPIDSTDIYTISTKSPPLSIGTQVFLNAEIRYYTKEGDQLGRGPLPPQIGKETKYWGIIQISNTTSRIENLQFSAILPSYVVWTGKTSVSHGSDVVFDPASKKISWSLSSLQPHSTTGLYIELSLTPTPEMSGTNPILLQNVTLETTDTFINIPISRFIQSLNSSLSSDTIGSSKGTIVQ